jgi:hypothetical protein
MKHTYDHIKSYFIKHGCQLLEDTYINAHTKMKYICVCGNMSSISFSNFNKGHRCQKCRNKNNSIHFSLDFNYVKNYFVEQGCELLENKYVNNHTKMKYKCKCGNVSTINFNNFKQGKRCRKCSGCEKYTTQYIANYFQEHECILIDEYTNSCTPMEYICKCGNKSKISWNNFKLGKRCKECRRTKLSGENNYQWRQDRKQVNLERLFARKCYFAVRHTLKLFGSKKTSKTNELLGYSLKDLEQHIINHPNWLNVKDKKWHLDHIFPIKAFVDIKLYNVKLVNDLDNLQPILGTDNISKNDKYNKKEFFEWLKEKFGLWNEDEELIELLEKIGEELN